MKNWIMAATTLEGGESACNIPLSSGLPTRGSINTMGKGDKHRQTNMIFYFPL